ncbi:MAG: FAD-binding protein [Desulfarculales bacterium]|nr:FAD-binding protein [Desulfarculales bacterium]
MTPDSLRALAKAAGRKNINTEPGIRALYHTDATQIQRFPQAVVRAVDREQVAAVLACCYHHELPLTPRGAGSGFTGGALAARGGVVLDMSSMLGTEVMPDHRLLKTGPGVLIDEIKKAAAVHSLFYPPDPSSAAFATIGGAVAENAGGLRAVKYGVTGDYVLGLEAVLMDGRIIRTGGQTNKSVVGYDLTRLLVGSEGTLAVITSITLKLIPQPEAVSILSAFFPSEQSALQTVGYLHSQPIVPTAMEFLDRRSLDAVRALGKISIPPGAGSLLLLEVDGPPEAVPRQTEELARILEGQGGFALKLAHERSQGEEIWKLRRGVSQAMHQLGSHKLNQDIALPLGSMGAFMEILDEAAAGLGVKIAVFGHVGDGNLHVNIMYNGKDPEETRRSQRAVQEIFAHTLHLGGSVSGEHGVGVKKLAGARLELNENALSMMWRIKDAFDPKGLLNPGKALPLL